jgi:hypothetical protein
VHCGFLTYVATLVEAAVHEKAVRRRGRASSIELLLLSLKVPVQVPQRAPAKCSTPQGAMTLRMRSAFGGSGLLQS